MHLILSRATQTRSQTWQQPKFVETSNHGVEQSRATTVDLDAAGDRVPLAGSAGRHEVETGSARLGSCRNGRNEIAGGGRGEGAPTRADPPPRRRSTPPSLRRRGGGGRGGGSSSSSSRAEEAKSSALPSLRVSCSRRGLSQFQE